MNKTNIEWCTHTWNPVTGCMRGCEYCYARRIHDRFNNTPFSNIVFHPERLRDVERLKKPAIIFVGSMSDIQYWKPQWTNIIIDACKNTPQHTFMFLSKNPKSYIGFNWPGNTMQGLTLTKCETIDDNYKITLLVGNCHKPYLSIEPLLGSFYFNPSFQIMEKIIVGAMTGPKAIKPNNEWIKSIQENIRGDKIFWKSNIKKYL